MSCRSVILYPQVYIQLVSSTWLKGFEFDQWKQNAANREPSSNRKTQNVYVPSSLKNHIISLIFLPAEFRLPAGVHPLHELQCAKLKITYVWTVTQDCGQFTSCLLRMLRHIFLPCAENQQWSQVHSLISDHQSVTTKRMAQAWVCHINEPQNDISSI